jgi:hypothetical protein
MTHRFISAFAIALGFLIVSVPLLAHHGNAEFNMAKTVTVKGTVTEWFWANPHCFLKFDEKTETGDVRHWVVETSNPPDMVNLGWSRYSMKPGDAVTVTMHQVKDPNRPIGRLTRVVLPNDKVLGTGAGDNAGSGAPKPEAYPK